MPDTPQPDQPESPKIEFDALAEEVVPDPAKYPDAVVLRRFVGRSAQDGHIRLYDNAGFQSYYEISVSDVLHSKQLPTAQAPLGGSLVYVKRSALLRRVQVSAEIEARFLEGPMSAIAMNAVGSLPGWARGTLLVRQRGPYLSVVRCPSDDRTSCADVCATVGCGVGGGGGITDDPNCIEVSFDPRVNLC
jgi:hypothetical protein